MTTTTNICTSNVASDVSLSKMSDYRKKFFVNVSGAHLGFDISEGSWDKDIQGLSVLQDYLDNEHFITLYVSLSNSNNKKQIHFQKDMLAPTTLESRIVVFYKNNPTVLNDDNLLTALHITSLQGPPTTALYHTLNYVFSPLIIKNERRSVNQNNIERQLVNLQTGLRTTILTGNSDLNPLKSVDPNSLTVVLSLEHEVEFWNNVAHTSKSLDLRTTSAALRDILQPLSRDFTVLEALPLTDVEDVLENAHNMLDDLWRHEPPYPKTRMEHLMDIIASDVCHCILKQASKCNFWAEEYNSVRDLLEQCIATGGRWVTSCKQLTEIFWPNYSLHAWTGEPYVPYNLVELLTRLDEVLNARTIHKQLVRLLTINEQNDLNTEDMFKPFQEIQILKYGNQSEQQWKTAKKQFEYLLQPVEQCVAFKLKKQLSSVDANTRQLLHEFGRYSELISRPILKQTLQNERQYLLSALKEYTKQLASPTSETTISKYDTPQVVDEILITRQAEAKATEIQKVAQKLLDDLRDYEDLNHSVSNLIANLKRQHNEMFESWTSEISAQIKNESLSLKETDPVVRFSNDKLMRVNYSPRFVSLISEVRQFSAMGYRIPSRIEDVGAHAKKFMKYASILEQIANFHNTIGDRMIPSQRPMMLASALNLSRLVQEEEVVSWGDITSVERYIENLKCAVENLSKENNLLAAYHVQVIEKIKTLEDVDLIKYYQQWKDSTKSMRDIMAQVQRKGFKSMQSWKVDVDRNLCKVLEIQYMKSLDTLHLYLPEIYADLIYRDSYLQFSPDEVVLKEKYEQQLKRFLEIPRSFRGVSDNAEANIFAEIMDRCKEKLSEVDKNTDGLFVQLKGVAKHWESWLTLESLDTSKLTSWEHWDLHFRASKTFGQEIAKLPSTEERVGCFIVGLSRLRSDLESHNRSYWDRLIVSLKDSIVNDVVRLQQYVDTSTATLNRQPLTLEQIGEADESHAIILKERPEMEKLYKEMIRKAQMLASWTREQIDSVNRLEAAWNRLQSLLENHEHIIAKQMHTIKTTLSIATENLNNEIERFAAKWDQVKPRPNSGQIANDTLSELHNYLTNIRQKRDQWKTLMEQKEKIINDNTKFGMDPAEFPLCSDIEEDLGKQEDTWSLFEEFYSDLERIRVEEWIVFRKKSYRLEEFLSDWQDRLQKLENTALITRMLKEIHKYQAAVPSLKYVRGEDFTEKHWMEVCDLLGMVPKPIDVLCLRDFLDVSDALVNNTKELQIICKKAASEIIVRQALAELDQWEVQSHFVLIDHLDSHNKTIMLIKDFKDILNKIGDNQSLLQSVKNSSDYDSFSQRAALWENKLSDLDQHLTALAQIQRKWVYLEPIFGGGTLVQERTRFERLDRDFRQLFQFVQKDARVCALCRYAGLRAVLENLHDQLGRCQKSLDEFLADKRNNFSRFLFLGDDDLLEIVGQSSKEHVIQSHLKKLFAGIHSIKLDDAQKKIVAICSLEGEIVGLSNSIDINQPVEIWLNALVKEMQTSLKDLLSACLKDGANVDPLKYPSQILCLADSVTFTTKCEQAINGMTLPPLLATYKTQLNHYSSLELNDDKSPSYVSCGKNDEGSNILELKLKALLLDTIHHINVIEELIYDNVTKVADWTWQKQLRFYRNNSAEVTIKMVNAKMEYAYEYLGNAPKLVRTPLTDQCFLTLTQGAHLGMGGNPYGPAGTGKTETVKALGCLLGRQVLVFNCDEGIDTSSMGRILSGLVRTGAWGCFDEFNRLDEATLSAISMQIQPIQNALKDHKDTVTLLDQQVQVNKHCGIFVTLNPAGGSYGGRNRLPDNLKQLFRPVVMTHPDHEQIARTLLHCDGYQNANVIGRKLVEIFSLSSKLLSKQQHYDWGLRALKTVLSGCSRALKQVKRKNATINEYGLVAQALKMDTVSKLTFVDSEKFQGLLNCVFPEVTTATTGHEALVVALEESCKELGLLVNKRQINKCVEFYEQLKQRMGVAIIGPPSSGKSSVRNILFHALNKMGRLLKQKVFNPKSLARTQLLGQIDIDTRQWTDGVLTLYSLQVTSESLDVWSWIVCDGDVDPEWVESLNSVLDDNKLLSLPSGWRIQFGPNVNFVFETHELSHASPATVSRMGVVFLSEEDLDVNDFLAKFLNEHPDASEVLRHYINDYYQKAIDWVLNEGEMVIPSSTIGITKTALSQLTNVTNKAQFTVQMINGLGGQLEQSLKENFAQQMFEWTKEAQPALPARAYFNHSRDIIESYYTNANQTIDAIENGLPLILTAQICQAMDCLRLWLKAGNEQHFVLVGPHGSAKSLLLENLIKERSDADLAVVHCSAHITPKYVIHKFAQHCIVVSSSKGRMYKPKKGHLFMYFKNIHLLKCDQWGTNLVIQFLQQLIALRGFFDNALEWVGIENVTIVGSLIVTNKLSVRFSSLVHIYSTDSPEKEELMVICNAHITAVLKKILPANHVWTNVKISKLTSTMITIYNEVKETFTLIEHQHYVFSPHEITKWCDGILRYKNTNDDDVEQFVLEVISYEALKLFGDKLVSEADREKLHKIINDALINDWGKSTLPKTTPNHFYVPITSTHSSRTTATLTKLNVDDWSNIVKKSITQYEREGQQLDIIITPEILHLTASISKILTASRGSALLVGSCGVGRKSSVRIMSAFQSAKLVAPATSNQPQFNNDLKFAMQQSGIEDEHVYLLLEDHLLRHENILNIVNTLLSSAEVPGLYNTAEFDSLIAGLKDEAGRENFEGNLSDFFVKRVQKKLHVVVCVDKDNEMFSNILENCPALYQKCSVVWLSGWTESTMENIPKMIIEQINGNGNSNEPIEVSDYFYKIHATIKSRIATPLRYVQLIKTYSKIYLEKKTTTINRKNKLQMGVSKLTEARNVVADLKLKAAEQQEKLTEKQEKANLALDMISTTMRNANTHKQEMEVLKQHTEKENELLIKRKKEIELELAEVEPLIQEARAAVGNIKAESLSEIRSLRAPPDIIRDILEGVLRLMGIQDTSWNSMKTFLAKRGVKEDIRSFDASKINPDSRVAVERLMHNKGDSFDPKASKRASVAAAPLASWVTANVRYSHVLDKIKPLSREQNRLKQNLESAKLQLGELSTGLTDVDATVAKLKDQLSTYTKEAAEIEIHLTRAQETLKAAEGLVGKLNDEYERWQSQLEELSLELQELSINCLLSGGFITYLSSEPEDIRTRIGSDWMEIIRSENSFNFTLEEFLSSEREQLQWQSEGISSDQLSMQNAIIILNSNLHSLIVDPTNVASEWIRVHFRHKTVETIAQNSQKFNTTLELAIRFGKILIIEEVDSVSPVLLPVLRQEFILQGERKMIKFHGKLIDYNNDFQLLLTSRNTQLKLTPDLMSVVNLVNFTITRAGLTEQLLISSIRQESPELEERRKQLLREREELQEKQYVLQNQLLEDLATSSGDILLNKNLLASLNETKASSNSIASALTESKIVQSKLQQEYDIYKEISSFGSSLYFAALEFSKINILYLLSVSSYVKLFLKSLTSLQGVQNTFGFLQRILIQSLYQYMGRGIFKAERLTFILHLLHKIYPTQISEHEWKFFLGYAVETKIEKSDDLPPWLPTHAVQQMSSLQSAFPRLYNSLNLSEHSAWKHFMDSSDCEINFPSHCKLSEFQKVLIIQALRPDRLYSTLILFVVHITGLKSINLDVLQLSQILQESEHSEPILLLTTSGTDPSVEIRDLAQLKVGLANYTEIAMGAGQETKAITTLNEASRLGHWLTLKNLHLVSSWLPELCQNLQNINGHPNFRLWLVTETHSLFSPVLSQNCLKISYEAPQGIKSNLQRTYATWGPDYIKKLHPTAARIFFVLSCIHALLQERRTYIPQGWSKWYEFSDVDLSTALKLLEEIWMNQNAQVPWKYFKGLCADAVYGGRIENIEDYSILDAYVQQYFDDSVLSHRWRPFQLNSPIPMSTNYQDYINAILQISNRDLPSYFGLPENIDRSWEKNISDGIIAKLKDLYRAKSISIKFDRQIWHRGLMPYMTLWKKLNHGQDYVKININTHVNGNENPIIEFIFEEFCNAIRLIQKIHKYFTILNKNIRGSLTPEKEIAEIASSLLNQQTPILWLKIWPGPLDPNKYLKTIITKAGNISKWRNEPVDYFFTTPMNLSLLFNPETLLAAFKLHVSRKHNVAIDELVLQTSWKMKQDAITLTGLLMEGALFDGYILSPCSQSSETINRIPNCCLSWSREKIAVVSEKIIDVPLFYTSNREKQVTSLQVPCNAKEKDKWIQAGLAIFISY